MDDDDDDDDDDDADDVWFLWGETHMLERSSNLNFYIGFSIMLPKRRSRNSSCSRGWDDLNKLPYPTWVAFGRKSPFFFAKGSKRAGNW